MHLQMWDTRSVNRFLVAYNDLIKEAVDTSCIRKSSIVDLVHERGWRFDNGINDWRLDFGQSQEYIDELENDLDGIRVYIDPAMPLSKEPGIVFRFNESGCLILKRR